MTEPSNAELVRRIEDLVKAVERLTDTVASTYATKEALKRVEDLHDAEIAELKKDNDARAGQSRQVIASLIVLAVGLLIPLIGTIQSAIGGGS